MTKAKAEKLQEKYLATHGFLVKTVVVAVSYTEARRIAQMQFPQDQIVTVWRIG